jgi:hypothetical protein
MTSELAWTDETRALVLPRRRHGVREPLPVDGAAAELVAAVYKLRAKGIVAGVGHAVGEARTVQQDVIAHFTTGARLSESNAAAAASLLGHELVQGREDTTGTICAALVDAWIEACGAAFAVRACAASTRFVVRRDAERALILAEYPVIQATDERDDTFAPLWRALRRRMATLPDAAYAEARDAAAALSKDASVHLRARLVFAFPDEGEWSASLARTVLDEDHRWLARGLLRSLADRELVERIVEAAGLDVVSLLPSAFDVADALGTEAETALLAMASWEVFAQPHYGFENEWRTAVSAVALLPTEAAAMFLLERLDDKVVRPAASALLSRTPRVGIVALAKVAARKKVGESQAALLASLVRASPEIARDSVTSLDEVAAKVVHELISKNAPVEDATLEELPELLVSPPWAPSATKKASPKKKTPVLELALLPNEERVDWTDVSKPFAFDVTATTHDGKYAVLERMVKSGKQIALWELAPLSNDVAREAFATFPLECWQPWGLEEELPSQLARFGEPAIATCLKLAEKRPGDTARALEAIVSPRVAPTMAHVLARVRRTRRVAERWLLRNARTAAIGLIPELFTKEKNARDNAGRALRFLAARAKRAVLDEVASAYGEEAVTGLESALSSDSLAAGAPSRPPKLPGWFDASALPRPLLAGRKKALPLSAVNRLAEMLAFTRADEPYAGLEVVREACDPVTLGDFVWGLYEAWSLAGHPMDEKWAFFAVGHFGRDEHARRLTPMIRVWPTDGAFPRAVVGLDVLATMRSEVALMLLHGISEKVKSRPLLAKAREKLESVAESLGLSPEELADRLVPTLGLDDDGARILDFGPRSFRVGFDESLRPFVQQIDAGTIGGRLADLPKPGKNDDAELAPAAHEEWKALKKTAKVAATQQIARFEVAMIAGRRWEVEAFRTYLVGHPLVRHLARRLVWGAYDEDKLTGTFRVAEDGTYADANDDVFVLAGEARVGVVHPLEIDPKTLASWGERLSEYAIIQPFPQVGREVPRHPTLADLERRVAVKTLELLALERRGWRRGAVGDGGVVGEFEKEAGALRVSLSIDPGIYAGDPKMHPVQTPGEITFRSTRAGTIEDPGAVFLAEVVADLRAVKALS